MEIAGKAAEILKAKEIRKRREAVITWILLQREVMCDDMLQSDWNGLTKEEIEDGLDYAANILKKEVK